jgi:multidrug resistance efflux pump
VLARLDRAEFETGLRLAKAKLKLAEARLAKAQTSAIKVDVAVAQAQVEVAQVEVEAAKLRLESSEIRAPISGAVLVKHAEAGNFVSPMGYQITARICDLADLRELAVEVSIAERDIHKVSKGMPCVIRLEAYPASAYTGRVERLSPVADRAKGTVAVRVRINVPEGDDRLRPELGAVVTLLAKE